jgi:phosphoserine phosphatase
MTERSRIFLVRHATSVSNHIGVYSEDLEEPLNSRGRNEAQLISNAFESTRVEKIVSSPFMRVRQTAEPVAASKSIKMIVDPRFAELSLGPWAGLRAAEIQQSFSEEWKIWRERPTELQLPGRENLDSLRARASEAFDELTLNYRCVAVFTHDAVIRVIVAHVLAVSNDVYRSIPIANASISLVVSSGSRHELHLLNSLCHLRGLA